MTTHTSSAAGALEPAILLGAGDSLLASLSIKYGPETTRPASRSWDPLGLTFYLPDGAGPAFSVRRLQGAGLGDTDQETDLPPGSPQERTPRDEDAGVLLQSQVAQHRPLTLRGSWGPRLPKSWSPTHCVYC